MAPNLLLASTERRWQRPLYRALRSTQCEIDVSHRLEEAVERIATGERDYVLFLVDYDSMPADVDDVLREVARQPNCPTILLLSERRSKTELLTLFQENFLSNFIAKDTVISTEEIVVTVSKILRNDIFGIEKYLTWGVEPEVEIIRHSREKDIYLDKFEEFMADMGISKRFAMLAKTVADEFLMNAIYNAPVDGEGSRRYSEYERTALIALSPAERVTFKYACDGRVLAISCLDNFGSLDLKTIKYYLAKCFTKDDRQIDQKKGGAGMGFYYVFESLSNFIINIDPGQSTEVIGLIDIAGTYRNFAERPKSFNVFLKRQRRGFS